MSWQILDWWFEWHAHALDQSLLFWPSSPLLLFYFSILLSFPPGPFKTNNNNENLQIFSFTFCFSNLLFLHICRSLNPKLIAKDKDQKVMIQFISFSSLIIFLCSSIVMNYYWLDRFKSTIYNSWLTPIQRPAFAVNFLPLAFYHLKTKNLHFVCNTSYC